jgi:hypothetical protein
MYADTPGNGVPLRASVPEREQSSAPPEYTHIQATSTASPLREKRTIGFGLMLTSVFARW